MQKNKIQEILDAWSPEEKDYDINVSLRIDAAARAGKDLSIEAAYQGLMQEVKSKSKHFPEKRLLTIKKIFETVSHQMSFFGLIDSKNSTLAKEYDAKFIDITFQSEKIMVDIAQSLAQKSNLLKCFVFIKHDNEIFSYGKLFYFEEDKLLTTCDLDKNYYFTLTDHLSKEKLLDLAFRLNNNNQIIHPYNNVLVRFASQSNNSKILHYLFQIAKKLDVVNMDVFINCLFMAIKNQCLSNVKALLEIQMSMFKFNKFDKVTIDFNLFSLLDNGKLNTAAPIIDIFMILYKNNIPLSGKPFSYSSELTAIHEEKIMHKQLILREAVAFHLLSLLMKPSDSYKQLLTAFCNSAMSEIPLFADKFCLENIDIAKYIDITVLNKFINPGIALRLDNLTFRKSKKETGFFPALTQALPEIMNLLFSKEASQLILQYLLPSLFDELSVMIENWAEFSASQIEFQDRKKALTTRCLPSKKQDNISDCGYWSLFNAFKMLIELPTSPSGYFKYYSPDLEIQKFTDQFKQFKSWIDCVEHRQDADLTPTILANIFNRAATGKEAKLSELFPTLQRRLLRWSESTSIPAYTIINSRLVKADEKLDLATFGGCLPGLKLQMAINFYRLAQLKDERLLHCILIGVDGHWHAQLLATSYFSKGSLDFFRADSDLGVTPIETLKLINRYLLELLKDSEAYVEIVAEELISPIKGNLLKLDQTASVSLGSGVREQEIQENCELLIKFFQAFGNLELAKKYLPALQLAKKIACSLKKDFLEFKGLSQQLTDLCYLNGQSRQQIDLCYLNGQSRQQTGLCDLKEQPAPRSTCLLM